MISEPGTIKLADFGASATLKTVTNATQKLRTVRGTPYWMAPEIIREAGYGRKSDIWSVACTIIEMATTKPPFSHMEPMPALFYIGTTDALPPLPPNLPSAHEVLTACFNRYVDHIYEMEIVNSDTQTLSLSLFPETRNPEARPSADQVLEKFEFVKVGNHVDESSDEEEEEDEDEDDEYRNPL